MHKDDWLEHCRSDDRIGKKWAVMRFEIPPVACTAFSYTDLGICHNFASLGYVWSFIAASDLSPDVFSGYKNRLPGLQCDLTCTVPMNTTSLETYAHALLQDPLIGSFFSLM